MDEPLNLLGLSGYQSPWKWDCFAVTISVNPITCLGTSQRQDSEQSSGAELILWITVTGKRTGSLQFCSVRLPSCKTMGKGVLYERWGIRRDLSLQLASHSCLLPICLAHCSQVKSYTIKFTYFKCKMMKF